MLLCSCTLTNPPTLPSGGSQPDHPTLFSTTLLMFLHDWRHLLLRRARGDSQVAKQGGKAAMCRLQSPMQHQKAYLMMSQ